jgi:hypothetical protein
MFFILKLILDMQWSINLVELSFTGTIYALLLMNSVVRYTAGQERKNKLGTCREYVL